MKFRFVKIIQNENDSNQQVQYNSDLENLCEEILKKIFSEKISKEFCLQLTDEFGAETLIGLCLIKQLLSDFEIELPQL